MANTGIKNSLLPSMFQNQNVTIQAKCEAHTTYTRYINSRSYSFQEGKVIILMNISIPIMDNKLGRTNNKQDTNYKRKHKILVNTQHLLLIKHIHVKINRSIITNCIVVNSYILY